MREGDFCLDEPPFCGDGRLARQGEDGLGGDLRSQSPRPPPSAVARDSGMPARGAGVQAAAGAAKREAWTLASTAACWPSDGVWGALSPSEASAAVPRFLAPGHQEGLLERGFWRAR